MNWTDKFVVYKGLKKIIEQPCGNDLQTGPAQTKFNLSNDYPAHDIVSDQLSEIIEAAKQVLILDMSTSDATLKFLDNLKNTVVKANSLFNLTTDYGLKNYKYSKIIKSKQKD